jgi:uncharacterized protein
MNPVGSADRQSRPARRPARPMRRPDREIVDAAGIDDVLRRATVLCIALRDEPAPYVVPVNFGWEEGTLYVHGATTGTKMDLLARDGRVGFCAWVDDALVTGETACDWGAQGASVVGTGIARLVTEPSEKLRGLDAIMRHYGQDRPVYKPPVLARTALIAIAVESLAGKRLG